MNFNHKMGCGKCLVIGEYDKESRRMCFANLNAVRRTDSMFRNRQQPQHHKERSPFEDLNINMISAFPTSDSLHLLHLGIMKKLLIRWIFGEKRYLNKWKEGVKDRISLLLTQCNSNMPTDIHRSVRCLKTLKYWKGLEFRTVLLYVGIVVLKEALNEQEYVHFLTLSCAVRLCSSKFYKKYRSIAEKMFRDFVEKYMFLYGRSTISSNVHNLIHICEDMDQLGVDELDLLSTYRYENSLRLLGLNVKHCNLPLEQVCRRVIESFEIKESHCLDSKSFKPFVQCKKLCDGSEYYEKVFNKSDSMLSAKKFGDQWFLTKTNDLVRMKYAITEVNEVKIIGNRLKNKSAFFTIPLTSTLLDIYTSNSELDYHDIEYSVNDVKAKMICLNSGQDYVLMPLLHTISNQ